MTSPHDVLTFPKGFLWGTATSSHQVEGQNTNNTWYLWEHQPNRILEGHTAGRACDWWAGRWKEDLDRAAAAGQNAHRLSVEWSRIQPKPDRWDEDALAYYREIIRGIRSRGMLPLVTLHHFTDPIWLAERGGWEQPETVILFGRYVEKVVHALGDLVTVWCTINEPNVYAYMGYVEGLFPPGKKSLRAAFRVMENLMRGHVAAYEALHRLQPEARVGLVHYYRPMLPARPRFPLDRLVARFYDRAFNNFFMEALLHSRAPTPWGRLRFPNVQGKQDFVGLNYYTTDQVAFTVSPGTFFGRRFYPPNAPLSEHGDIAHIPDGLDLALRWAARAGLPILVTENGVEDSRDILRPRYIVEHLYVLWKALRRGVPVFGYFHWTLVDNFEWERGWTRRFGLWALDPETQVRTKRPSADLYAAIAQANALTVDAVARYAPVSLHKIFPHLPEMKGTEPISWDDV